METNDHGYLNQLFGFSDELKKFTMSFKDDFLEEIYLKEDKKNQLKKSKIFFVLVMSVYFLALILSIIINKEITKNGYYVLSGILLEIILSVLNHIFSKVNKFFVLCKYLRFFLFYCILIIIMLSMRDKLNAFDNLRVAYGAMLYINFVYLYIIEFNYFILLFIPLVNALILYYLKQMGSFGNLNVYVDISVIFIYYFCTFFIKKEELFNKKNSFFNSYRNSHHVEYTRELINVVKNMVICISKNDVIFSNRYTDKYLKNKRDSFLNNVITEEDFKRIHILGEEALFRVNTKTKTESFFKSLTMTLPNDTDQLTNKNLLEIIKEYSENEGKSSKNFERLGYFTNIDKHNSNYFDVYIRKLIFKEDIIEILIYDISEIKLAEKRNIETKYKEKILSKIAHEFKTPLITIISLVEKIFREKYQMDSNSQRVLSYIDNLSNYVLCLVSDIIQYASNNIDIRVHKCDLNIKETLNFSFNVLKTLIECNENKNGKILATLEVDTNLNNLIINTDENRFKQLLLNFISNAVKFTTSGFIKIILKKKNNPDYIKISIKDTGIGIKDENKSLIFQENIQLNLESEYNVRGSGLGLSIAKKLASLLNFEIGFNSTYEKGSKFFIKINEFKEGIYY